MTTTRKRENLSFEDIAGEYRVFFLVNNETPREVVCDKKNEVVSVRLGTEPPIRDIILANDSNPCGLHLYSHDGGMWAYTTAGRAWINTENREFPFLKAFFPAPYTIRLDPATKSRRSIWSRA